MTVPRIEKINESPQPVNSRHPELWAELPQRVQAVWKCDLHRCGSDFGGDLTAWLCRKAGTSFVSGSRATKVHWSPTR